MPANMKLTDLIDYTCVLPYASELFGIYQPLLGWKSERSARRFQRGFQSDKVRLIERLRRFFADEVDIRFDRDCQVQVAIKSGALHAGKTRAFRSLLMQEISKKLPPFL